MASLVTTERMGDVAIVRMNDEASLNAMSTTMADELRTALVEAAETSRAIVLTGAGRGFCSGANLSAPADRGSGPFDIGEPLRNHFNPLMLAVRDLKVPLVVAVNGPAAGLGAPLALAGDLIVAARDSYFLQAFRRLGLVPDGGSAYLLTRTAGRARAMEMMLLGERISAETALSWGMINRVVEPESLIETAVELAQTLAAGPTKALAAMRALCWRAFDDSFEDQLAIEADMQSEMGRTRDFREGITAFREKRPAQFRGD